MHRFYFQFDNFTIIRSLFDLNQTDEVGELSVGFESKGKLNFEKGRFNLELGIFVSDSSENVEIEKESIGYFIFKKLNRETYRIFFCQCSDDIISIINAYISSLSVLSGIKQIVLLTLNLTILKDVSQCNFQDVSL